MFFVFADEMLAKFNEHLLGNRMDVPGVACHGEDASYLEHEEGEVFDGIVSQASPPVMEMHWISQSYSHRVSMGSLGVQMVAMLVQLFPNLAHMMGL